MAERLTRDQLERFITIARRQGCKELVTELTERLKKLEAANGPDER